MQRVNKLHFTPCFGLSSRHLQMIVGAYAPTGKAPPSQQWLVDIGNGDKLSCEVSTPVNWNNGSTVAMIHGLGGCHTSNYMIRMARKLYEKGYKVVRINLRECGSGAGLSSLPYCAGNSQDILSVLQSLKAESPDSAITLVGFSLGGNIALKLAGELGDDAEKVVKTVIAVCPPLDLEHTVRLIGGKHNRLYHRYYLKNISKQCHRWIKHKIHSIYEYDDTVTGPLWGFGGAKRYYEHCSSQKYLSQIQCETHIIFAKDDPFVSMHPLQDLHLSPKVHLWVTESGSHMGFLGQSPFQWIDELLLNWIDGKF